MKIKIYLFLCIISGFFASCNPKIDTKTPVNLSTSIDIEKIDSHQGYLTFQSGSINISELSFEGKREQGSDVYFSVPFQNGLTLNFDSQNIINELNFEIPQGVYTQIKFSVFSTNRQQLRESENIILNGDLTIDKEIAEGEQQVTYKIIVKIDSDILFKAFARNNKNESQMVISADKSYLATIKINPIYWFQVVPFSILEEAIEKEISSGFPNEPLNTMFIDKVNHREIYELFIGRIGESTKVTITEN